MPIEKLTDRKIASFKPGKMRIEYWDESTPGFGIRISTGGTKTFFAMYRFAGMRRRLKLGRYPEVALAEARRNAKKALAKVGDGKDPVQERKAEEAKAKREPLETKTFGQLAALYIEEYARQNKKSWREDERIINKILNPEFGSLNVKDITRSHVRSFLSGIAVKAKVKANRTHACLRKILNWAIKEEIVELEGNPAAGITRPGGKEMPKERTLSDDELRDVWRELEKFPSQVGKVLRLILLTAQRPGEVMEARWDEFDFKECLWTIPGSRTKNGLANIVPLNALAMRIFEQQREILIAQRQRRENNDDTTTGSPFVFPNRLRTKYADAPITHIRKATGRIWRALKIESFSAHDLRRTCATKLGQMQIPGHVIARVLNHKQTDVTSAVYNQYEYLKEKREALNSWGTRLSKIVSGLELVKAKKTRPRSTQ